MAAESYYLGNLVFRVDDDFSAEPIAWDKLSDEKKQQFMERILSENAHLRKENAYLKRLALTQVTGTTDGLDEFMDSIR